MEKDTILSENGKEKNTTPAELRINPRFCQDKSRLLNQEAKTQPVYPLIRFKSSWFKQSPGTNMRHSADGVETTCVLTKERFAPVEWTLLSVHFMI